MDGQGADLVPSEARGSAYGLFNAAIGLTALPASVLAGLLWPDWPQKAALSNLRYALADLRKNLGKLVTGAR